MRVTNAIALEVLIESLGPYNYFSAVSDNGWRSLLNHIIADCIDMTPESPQQLLSRCHGSPQCDANGRFRSTTLKVGIFKPGAGCVWLISPLALHSRILPNGI